MLSLFSTDAENGQVSGDNWEKSGFNYEFSARRYRDAHDELAKNIKNYADDEEINESLRNGLKSFTNAMTITGDYMDINVHRMELKV